MPAFRLALRTLLRDRAFSAAVILSLALGIGANTAIFSLVNTVLLQPLPYREPERLVTISEIIPKVTHLYPSIPANLSHYLDWRDTSRSFESLAAFESFTTNVSGPGEPELLVGAAVSANFFETLGVRPALGRSFHPRENDAGRDQVIVISDTLWTRRFARDPAVIGRKVTLDGRPAEIVGVLPPSFRALFPTTFRARTAGVRLEVFKPFSVASRAKLSREGEYNYTVIGRLRPGVTREQAQSELNVLQAGIDKTMSEPVKLGAVIKPLHDEVAGKVRRGLLLVMSAVGAVLLILCLNLANLSLVRATARARDFAIRTALGAGRVQIVRDVLAESLLLALLGGALGVGLAYAGVRGLVYAAPFDLPRLEDAAVDGSVLLFALAASLACGLFFGILPALKSWMSAPQEALKSGTHATEGARGLRIRHLLVGLEVGVSVVLLVVAGLLSASFVRVMNVDKGFDVESALAVQISLPAEKYKDQARRAELFDRVNEKVRALPGVTASGIVSALPLQGETWVDVVGVEHDTRPFFERPTVNVRFISEGYFDTLGIKLRSGRMFNDSDRKRRVAIVSERVARTLWGDREAVGRKMLHNTNAVEIVGVVGDLRITELDKEPVRMLYIPHWERPRTLASLVVRTGTDPRGTAAAIRKAIWEIDSQVPITEMKLMSDVLAESVAQRRFQMLLVSVFAIAALGLASLGLYGVLAYSVTRRRLEIGIRMALGASPESVRGMLLRQGLKPVAAGLAAGLAGALAAGQLVRSLLFEVSDRDPAIFAGVAAVLGCVAVAACLLPAAQATRVDPCSALRCD